MDQECRNQIISEDYADFMMKTGQSFEDIKTRLNVCYDIVSPNNVNVYTSIANLPKNMIQLYGFGVYPNCYGLLDIKSMDASGVTKLRNIPSLNLRGQGVVIGVVDTGIDYTHKAFRNADGTSKILSIWDQTVESEVRPDGLNFGTEYTNEQINAALASDNPHLVVPSIDEDGHGTYLAGIAAGNRDEDFGFSGVAPDANLIVVKLKPAKKFLRNFWLIPDSATCFQKNDLIYGIKYLYDTANKLRRPLSLFIGIGTSQGAHDERGTLSSYLSYLASQSGVSIVIAGGNEGNRGHHYMGSVAKGVSYDTVELRVGPNETGFSMELWGIAPNTFSIDILSPSGEYIPRIPARLGESREIRFIFETTVINIDYQLVESQSGDELILMRFRGPTEGIWRFKVYANNTLPSTFHIWLPIHQFISSETYFLKSNPDYTLTSPGNTFIPIVTTAYDYTNQSLYLNASRGFMRNENVAPTLAAPGVNILGPDLNNGYKVASGTSVAAAHTAGIAAMLLEWGIIKGNFPQIDTVEIKNLLIRGAKRDATITYPSKEWGYGILDIYNTYASLRGND